MSALDKLWSFDAIQNIGNQLSSKLSNSLTVLIVGAPNSNINTVYNAALGIAASLPPLPWNSSHGIQSNVNYEKKTVAIKITYEASGIWQTNINVFSGTNVMRRGVLMSSRIVAGVGTVELDMKMPEDFPKVLTPLGDEDGIHFYAPAPPEAGVTVLTTAPDKNPKLGSERGTYSGKPTPLAAAPLADPCDSPERPEGVVAPKNDWNGTVLPYLKQLFGVT